MWSRHAHFCIHKFHILVEDFIGEAFHVNRLTHCFVQSKCSFLHLFVFLSDVLLDAAHISRIVVDAFQFVIRLG